MVAFTSVGLDPPPMDARSEFSDALTTGPIDTGRQTASHSKEDTAARPDMIADMRMEEKWRRSGVLRSKVRSCNTVSGKRITG